MPRCARRKSETGVYHIMIRGINKEKIFIDDEDCRRFLKTLKDCKEISRFKLYAYCLMGNHVHLLLQEGDENIDLIVKRIGSRYVYWFNAKYQRVGHLFQDRYKSEPVDNDEYFLSALRYIHCNPVKAKMVASCEEYKFSSYNEYFGSGALVDCEDILKDFDIDRFVEFHKQYDDVVHIEYVENEQKKIIDEEAERLIKSLSNCTSIEEFQNLPRKKQGELINRFKKCGLSIRQIMLFTGLGQFKIRNF